MVIPFFNEAENILPLIREVSSIMTGIDKPWELLMIDDGSTDETGAILEKLVREDSSYRLLSFDRNYGQSSAFDAGFRNAKGRYIITLDGDGQNDPKDIPRLLELAKAFDLVCGKRQKRRDTWVKRIISFFANRVRQRICQDGVQDTGCSLKIYRRQCFERIKLFDGMHRFLPALFTLEGFQVHEVPVSHRERRAGSSKYSLFNRSWNTIADLLAVRWMRKRRLQYKIKEKNHAD